MIKAIVKKFIPASLVRYRLEEDDNKVALTFDDGPHPVNTKKIIKILDDEEIKATFFMVGKEIEKNRDIVQLVLSQGHTIANHGYSHKPLRRDTLEDEVYRTEMIIEEIAGFSNHIFRPPYGNITVSLLKHCINKKLHIVLWSLDSGDFEETSLEGMRCRVNKAVKRDIILFHEDYDYTVEALPELIADIKDKGLEFATIPQGRK